MKDRMEYANIIVDISLGKLDKTFQYRIPERLAGQISPGVLVEVPFGNGTRVVRGYVVEMTDTPEFDVARIKEIRAVVEGSIPIESQLIALAAWIRENFGGTMNQALKTVLPVKVKTAKKEKRLIYLLPERAQAERLLDELTRKHRTARARLLAALLEQSPIPYEDVTGKLGMTAKVIRAMEEKQMLRVESVRAHRNPMERMPGVGTRDVRQADAFGQGRDAAGGGEKELAKQQSGILLNGVQRRIADDILVRWRQGDWKPSLIHGVTGSGKTEVYIELIEAAVRAGRQSIVLIPEIALTFQTVLRFYRHFGDRVSILHSRLSAGERYDQFERAKTGALDVMIGPRSALFTPFPNLGFIIIDEEHEASYKSETVPCYHARETAIARAGMCGAMVVLGSATPSVESYGRALSGEYHLYEMKHRVSDRQLPTVYTVDLREELRRGNRSILSDRLRELMVDRLQRHEQTMLFINRRGVAGFVSCRSCGHVMKCPHCDVSLHLHNNGRLMCHYCGYSEPMVKNCPACGSRYVGTFKAGTQKIEQYIREQFPQARVLRMDFDTTRQRESYEQILSAFANQEADILIGTQMIVKGHDFPNVTLVGVLAADLSLHVGDYRASERTFQLLTQAAGRAGRGKRPGEVVIQTYAPEHFAVVAASHQDYEGFYAREAGFRRLMHYPPSWNMLVVHVTSAKETLADEAASVLQCLIAEKTGIAGGESLRSDECTGDGAQERFPDNGCGIQLIGPADASIAKVNDIYHKVIYLKAEDYQALVSVKNALDAKLRGHEVLKKVNVRFDFNPMNGF